VVPILDTSRPAKIANDKNEPKDRLLSSFILPLQERVILILNLSGNKKSTVNGGW
jgi:hypothetical protein